MPYYKQMTNDKGQTADPAISIIIPVLNEAANLARTLQSVQCPSLQASDLEVIVVDGGSRDATVEIAKEWGAQVVFSAPGRSRQMNAGAAIAQGTILVFLHGDTRLPANYPALVHQTLAQPGVVAGAFDLAIDGTGWGFQWIEWGVRLRSRWLQLPYGDQALFLTRQVFQTVGGFPDLPIMEDFVLVQQLQKLGNVAIAPAAVLTCDRRWQKLGILKTTLINQLILMGYGLGVSPRQLAEWYHKVR